MNIKAINYNDPHDWARLKECVTKSMLRSDRLKNYFYQNKFSKSDGDPRKTWQVINELTPRKTGRSSVRELSLNGVLIEWNPALRTPALYGQLMYFL